MKCLGDVTFFVRRFKSQEAGKPDRLVFTTDVKREFDAVGGVVRRSIDILFTKKNFPEEKLNQLQEDTAYTMEVKDGWLTLNRFIKKGEINYTYNIALQVNDGTIKKATKVDVEKREKAKSMKQAQTQAETLEIWNPLDGSEKSGDGDLPF